jgi:hypothetical protein
VAAVAVRPAVEAGIPVRKKIWQRAWVKRKETRGGRKARRKESVLGQPTKVCMPRPVYNAQSTPTRLIHKRPLAFF